MKRAPALFAVLLFGVLFGILVADYRERQTLSPLAQHYLTQVPEELGAPNVVTGILITFRGFDTLGEVSAMNRKRSPAGWKVTKAAAS
jgi:multicomponent Na+:H+ antiporter subunit B